MSYLTVLLTHILKYQYQTEVINPMLPEPKIFKSWEITINHSRNSILKTLKKYPYLEKRIPSIFDEVYTSAKENAIFEMNLYISNSSKLLNADSFSEYCPWSIAEILKKRWLPTDCFKGKN